MTLYQGGDVRWVVELGLTNEENPGSVWDSALWDTGVWSGYEPSYVDVSAYALAINFKWGAARFGVRIQTGRAYVTFDNQDGAFNPDFGADLPGQLDLRLGRWCRITAIETTELPPEPISTLTGLVTQTGNNFIIGTSQPASNVTPTQTEGVDNFYLGSFGQFFWNARFGDGTAQIPSLGAGDLRVVIPEIGLDETYAWNGTQLRYQGSSAVDLWAELGALVGQQVTMQLWDANAVPTPMETEWVLFEGQIDAIDEVYLAGASDSSTRITVYDFAAAMALDNPPALEAPVGGGELTSARVNRVLDEFGPVDGGWPWRDIFVGDHTMQASTLAQNRLEETQRAAEAEGSVFWFRNRYARFRPFQWLTGRNGEFPRTVQVQMWPGRGFATDPELVDADAEWDGIQLRNDIQLSRVGGTAVRVQSSQSQVLYGQRTYRRLDLQNDDDTQVADLANRYLYLYEWDYQRLESVTLRANTVDQAHNIFRTELGDLVQATIPLTLRGWGYAVEAHVIGIEYTVTPDDWSCVLRIDQAFRQAPGDAGAYDDGYDDGYLIGGD